MLCIFSSYPFYTKYVLLPTADDPVPSEICENPKLWPYFKDALGALDSSHIHSSPPAIQRLFHRNRKGSISQNCLFGCSFDLQFVYAYGAGHLVTTTFGQWPIWPGQENLLLY